MRKIILITALAVLTVFMAVSCAPEADISGYNWKGANEGYAAKGNFDAEDVYPKVDSIDEADNGNIELSIKFPAEADILKNVTIDELKSFFTVHTFTNPEDAATKGLISSLGSSIDYSLIRQIADTLLLEVKAKYSTLGVAGTDYVIKINSANYKFAGGHLMDRDGNGTGGEAGYDDYYIPYEYNIVNFIAPGNKGWYITLNTDITTTPNVSWDSSSSTTSNSTSIIAATIYTDSLTYINTNDTKAAAHKDIGDKAGKFTLQEFDGTSWIDVATAVYAEITGYMWDGVTVNNKYGRFEINNVKFKHKTMYRVKWTGSADITTGGDYSGVKQRIRVLRGTEAPSTRSAYNRTELISTARGIYNSNIGITYNAGFTSVRVVSPQDFTGKNIVLRVEVPLRDSYTIGLAEMAKDAFLKSFKLVYLPSSKTWAGFDDPSPVEIKIKDVKFGKEDVIGTGGTVLHTNSTLFNVIYLTLDPNFQLNADNRFYILANDEFKYTKEYVYGSWTNWRFNNFDYYLISIANAVTFPAPILPADVSVTMGTHSDSDSSADVEFDTIAGGRKAEVKETGNRWDGYIYASYTTSTGNTYVYTFSVRTGGGTRPIYVQAYWDEETGSIGKVFNIGQNWSTFTYTAKMPASFAVTHNSNLQFQIADILGVVEVRNVKIVRLP